MVRSVFVAVVSFALIFGLYLFCDGACRRASEVLIRDCREVEERIRLGKKEEALMLGAESGLLFFFCGSSANGADPGIFAHCAHCSGTGGGV